MAKIKAGVEGLTREIMTLQAEGNYEKAKDLGERLGVVRPEGAAGARPTAGRAGRYRAPLHHRGAVASRRTLSYGETFTERSASEARPSGVSREGTGDGGGAPSQS